MRHGEALGFHGLVLPSRDPEGEARKWTAALGWPVLRRSRHEVVLGLGPELFVALVRVRGKAAPPPEVHLAVRELRDANRRKDSMGGDSVERDFSGARLIVREFCRPPASTWSPSRAAQRASPSRRSGKGRARSK
jgi:hypothetical protein